MNEVLTSAQMRAIEQAAIGSGAVTGLELMERAGEGVVAAVLAEWPNLAEGGYRAAVLCGPGNNGGDGFVVARLLKARGWEVEVYLYGSPDRMPPDARANHDRWVALGNVFPSTAFDPRLRRDLFVDAIFGTGLTRKLDAEASRLVSQLDCARVVAIDCPSGYCLDSGRALFDGVEPNSAAELTVTFQFPKIGHFLADGPVAMGKLRLVDLGLGACTRHEQDPSAVVTLVEAASHRQADAPLAKFTRNHKYSHGHALLLSGSSGHGGAARLAARGALRIGAGLVTLGCPPDAMAETAARLDAVMLRPLADGAALSEVLADRRITAVCLGPGMGTGDREAGMLAAALTDPAPGLTRGLAPRRESENAGGPGSSPGRGLVLDADALSLLAQHPEMFAALHARCVLTPHAGEFARLFPDIAAKLAEPATKGPAYSKVDATREAAARAGCVVLFKGPDTVIAGPAGRCAINSAHYDRAAPWLATAGSGDVLAGFITGLLARGANAFDAACTAAWLHVECARSFGPGLIAQDLPEELPKVFRSLGL
ncbi:MAG: NAD(P)H-hydrate epimerase [Gemmobacter sp.]|nr:NAD(P)H-hydrate epimerase [Gemmobacter sp.]